MCGIIGYVGKRPAKDILLAGLERLEFRGYDSAGIALPEADGLEYVRAVGNLANLKRVAGPNGSAATAGLGHTRWATHGGVTVGERPSADRLRRRRSSRSCSTASSRTTASSRPNSRPPATLQLPDRRRGRLATCSRTSTTVTSPRPSARCTRRLEGHFTFVVIHRDHPDTLVGVRCETPLVVGLGESENFLASNLGAFLSETRRVQFPDNGQVVEITSAGVRVVDAADGAAGRASRSSRSSGTRRSPSAAATRRSWRRRSTSSPRASARRSATASATATSCSRGSA